MHASWPPEFRKKVEALRLPELGAVLAELPFSAIRIAGDLPASEHGFHEIL